MTAKDLVIKPIAAKDARDFVRKTHYSGKVDTRSQLNIGVFYNGKLEGVLQFGPSLDKRKSIGLVKGTLWNEYLDLHRLAFSEKLPRNSESRALAVSFKLIKKHYPHIKWVLSYADAAQCGDGTIYRAAGFVLTQIKKNNSMWKLPDGTVHCKIVFEPGFQPNAGKNSVKYKYGKSGSETSSAFLKRIGAHPIPGYQFRYIYFLHPNERQNLTVPIIPFSEIPNETRMYRGESLHSKRLE